MTTKTEEKEMSDPNADDINRVRDNLWSALAGQRFEVGMTAMVETMASGLAETRDEELFEHGLSLTLRCLEEDARRRYADIASRIEH